MIESVYYASLAVIILVAVIIALHPAIPTGPLGTACAGAVAIFAVAGYDAAPTRWMAGMTASIAVTCVLALMCMCRVHRQDRADDAHL